jgi:hypothetical protein
MDDREVMIARALGRSARGDPPLLCPALPLWSELVDILFIESARTRFDEPRIVQSP